MLNGVGGFTVEEAKERMTVSEYHDWLLFREKYGPLTLHMRVDRAAALIVQAHRGGSMEKLMPWGKARPKEIPAHVASKAAAVDQYTDEQLAAQGLYRDDAGVIRRKVSKVGQRAIGGVLVDPSNKTQVDFAERRAAVQRAQEAQRNQATPLPRFLDTNPGKK